MLNIGFHHTKESKAKISLAHKGKILTEEHKVKLSKAQKVKWQNPEYRAKMIQAGIGNKRRLGHPHTEEAKAKMSRVHMGATLTEETKAKISKAHMGRVLSEEHKAKISQSKLGKHRSEDTKNKLRIAHTGMVLSEENKAKISQSLLGNKRALGLCHTEETRNIIRQANLGQKRTLGYKQSEETRANMSKAQKGREKTEEHRAKIGKAHLGMIATEETRAIMRKNWMKPELRNKRLRASMLGRFIHPNKPETLLLGLLESTYPNEWKFVGDGSLIIGGKNPDFANVNGQKQLMEMWGDYWHQGEDPQERIDIFKNYGFRALIIWESEMNHPEKVLERIVEFVGEKESCH